MRNPLYKRLPRDFASEVGKYIALFLFLCLLCGFVSGYLVANSSMLAAYDESFDKYDIENGHFVLAYDKVKEELIKEYAKELPEVGDDTGAFEKWMIEGYRDEIANEIDKELEKDADKQIAKVESCGVAVERMYYKDKEIESENVRGDIIRLYKDRPDMNKVVIWRGQIPDWDHAIAIDRLYAENNGLEIGDKLTIDDTQFVIIGLVAFSDYSTLFETNNQLMFDANHFTVAVITDNAWDDLSDAGTTYCYSWRNDDQTLTDNEQRDKAEEILDTLKSSKLLTDIVSRPDNQALMFTGDDIGGDMVMMNWLYYITMAVKAFIFAVNAKTTIEKDSRAVGTLKASGYTNGELLRYYISLPMILTAVASVIGTILGYTAFKHIIVMAYYHSYSLTPYVTIWNGRAFVMTVIYPLIMIFVINAIILSHTLRLSPMQFLRGELRRDRKSRNAVRLPNWSFPARFRARVILQNKGAYFTMLVGILFASVLLVFGVMMSPLMKHYREDVETSKFADYQYVLKAEYEVSNESAEKYAFRTLDDDGVDSLSIYGISRDSQYFKEDLPAYDPETTEQSGAAKKTWPVRVSSSYMEKFGLDEGSIITLHDEYNDKDYDFYIESTIEYPASLALFMDINEYRDAFDEDSDYYTGYFSDVRLDDEVPDEYIATVIDEHDLTLIADQLEDSMSAIFWLFGAFATILFVLMVYLLSKITIERNTYSISMVKILGYDDGEIGSLYNRANGIVAISSLIISLFVAERAIKWIYFEMMKGYPGWLSYYVAPSCFIELIVLGLATYGLVSIILMRKIRAIPMAEALKGTE